MALTKPRIIELLLVTTLPTMIVAQRGMPSIGLIVATLVGGTLAAGGANAINMFVDRDIDRLMHRTEKRPLVTGAVTPTAALVFALSLEVLAFAELWWLVNLLSAVLAVSATAFYVFVYTLWLKRRSTQNIVIGGAAGAVPVLVGWAAVTGHPLAGPPVVLFAVIFVWTPPHFWALAVRYQDDYEAANVPMLPAVASLPRTTREIVFYTVPRRGDARVHPGGPHGLDLVHRRRARRRLPRHGRPDVAARPPRPGHRQGRHAPVRLLDHLPDGALRRHGRRRPHPAPLTNESFPALT